MGYKITLIPGDGTGPEIAESTKKVLDATGVKIDWEVVEAGSDVAEKYGTPLPENVIKSSFGSPAKKAFSSSFINPTGPYSVLLCKVRWVVLPPSQ